MTTPLPEPKDVKDLLTGLIGRECEVIVSRTAVTGATRPGILVATYVTENFRNQAIVALDTAAAAHLGAAIGLVPQATAQSAISLGSPSVTLLENVSEVLNVMAALFNVDDAPHVKLAGVQDSTETAVSADLWKWLEAPGPRLDVTVGVQGYGSGQMSIILR